jgi:hypothetical protein
MDETSTLGIIAFGLQFIILVSAMSLLNMKIQRIERAKCRCCDVGHALLDPV